ncbi:MAG: hypothetical protein WC877_00265 [Dehalococcoidales bacterium]|jgi:hypothetical protein
MGKQDFSKSELEHITEYFSMGMPGTYYRGKSQDLGFDSVTPHGTPAGATAITSTLANFLIELTNFDELNERDIYEQLFVWEPEVAAVVNKVAEMVRSSYDCFMLIDDSNFDNIPSNLKIGYVTEGDENSLEEANELTEVGELGESSIDREITTSTSEKRDAMKDTANEIARRIDIPSIIETWAAVLYLHGEIYLEKHQNLSLTILPNNRITIVDDKDRILMNANPNTIIAEENYLVIDERLETERVLEKNQFIHIKMSDVPLNIIDTKGRQTFGIYAISPLHRAVIGIWMKRQVYIIRTLWGWANVPREHHVINAEAFSFDKFPGTPAQKKVAAEKAIQSFMYNYAAGLKTDAPDQKYITSSNIEVRNIEHAGNAFMDDDKFLDQIDNTIWDALGMPKSVIRGLSDGSYASELIVASGASLRIEQIARRISRVILENMRERLLLIDSTFAVDHLDIKISFEIAESRLEKAKIAQLKKDLGVCTATEIREELNLQPLTEQQITEEGIVTAGNITIIKSFDELSMDNQAQVQTDASIQLEKAKANFGGQKLRSDGKVNYPSTPKSREQQPTDSATSKSKRVLNKE